MSVRNLCSVNGNKNRFLNAFLNTLYLSSKKKIIFFGNRIIFLRCWKQNSATRNKFTQLHIYTNNYLISKKKIIFLFVMAYRLKSVWDQTFWKKKPNCKYDWNVVRALRCHVLWIPAATCGLIFCFFEFTVSKWHIGSE